MITNNPFSTLSETVPSIAMQGFLIVMIGNRTEWSSLIKDTLTIGVLASFTTFSTFTVASIHLWQSGDYSKALYNLGGSIIIGLFAAWLGLTVGNQVS